MADSNKANLEAIIQLYLGMDTNYALLITGPWGVGKTHYYRSVLSNSITQTRTIRNNAKKYRPVHISLFGLNSIEDVQSQILLELFPILKKAKLKLAGEAGKALIKGMMQLKGLGEYSKLVESVKVEKKGLLDFGNLVLCFDDLERKSEKLTLQELIGYINTLVETENAKILLIANEGAIAGPTYTDLKDKVIGNTVEFVPDMKAAYDGILKERFAASMVYSSFLKEQKTFIVEMISSQTENLRTLIFIVEYFQFIFSEINNQLFIEKALKDKQGEILQNLLRFTIAVAIEYKAGKLSYKKREGLEEFADFNFQSFFSDNSPTNNAPNDVEREPNFKEKYYNSDIPYYFYASVYDYLTGGTAFEYARLLEELKRQYHIKDELIPPQYEIFNVLHYQSCFSLSDESYNTLTKSMLSYAYEGAYEIVHYMTIFHFATRFENPLGLDLDELEKALTEGMQKAKEHCHYSADLNFRLHISADAENVEYLRRLREVALDLNAEMNNKLQSLKLAALEQLCYDDFKSFYEKVLDPKGEFRFDPVFTHFNVDNFLAFFQESKPDRKWEVARFFGERYGRGILASQLKPEQAFLVKLHNQLKVENATLKGVGVTGFVVSELTKNVEKAIGLISAA